jgi:hypothetical protein
MRDELTTYLTLGLFDRDGREVLPEVGVPSQLPLLADTLRAEVARLLQWVKAPSATVYTFAIGTGIDEHGNPEPCAIWAIGGLSAAQARTIAETLAEDYNQRCVTLTRGRPAFVAPLTGGA